MKLTRMDQEIARILAYQVKQHLGDVLDGFDLGISLISYGLDSYNLAYGYTSKRWLDTFQDDFRWSLPYIRNEWGYTRIDQDLRENPVQAQIMIVAFLANDSMTVVDNYNGQIDALTDAFGKICLNEKLAAVFAVVSK